jgi:CubicO group peptidase (beta-lactamase class C family)
MIGTLIVQLVNDGKLRLDETIERWFPTCQGCATSRSENWAT